MLLKMIPRLDFSGAHVVFSRRTWGVLLCPKEKISERRDPAEMRQLNQSQGKMSYKILSL